MQKAKSNGKREKKFFFPACQLERARVLGFLAKHLAAIKGNKGSEGIEEEAASPKYGYGSHIQAYSSYIRSLMVCAGT